VTHFIHDFRAKLRQPSIARQVQKYVRWRRAVRRARAEGVTEPPVPVFAPVSINLDLTTGCNFRCAHCIDRAILNTADKHRDSELRDSIELISRRGLRSVILIGGGEPTLYPGFSDFVRYLKQLDLQVAIVSNGSRGDRLVEAVEFMKENDWIRLSLDAGSNQLFRDMHRPATAGCDLDSICGWVPKIKAANPNVRVGYSFVIVWRGAFGGGEDIRENIHEIAMAAERAKRFGFDYISLKPVLERRESGAEVMDPAKIDKESAEIGRRIHSEVDRATEFADENFDVYVSTNLRALNAGNWADFTRQPQECHMQALRQVLNPTGLYNCPAHRGVERARIASAGAYRNEDTARATDLALGRILDCFDASRECSEVTCLYNKVNWWLEEMIEDPHGDAEIESGEDQDDFFL
jgi:wyosine [tRNA(Phe)-imidazoG37] synthetase (radical SAM superfamily)